MGEIVLLLDRPGIQIGSFTIYAYAIIIVCGILAATILSALLMKRRNVSPDLVLPLFVFCIPAALVCARLYYCITDQMDPALWFQWESIRQGGLSILGGVLGGVLAGVLVCLVKRVDFFRVADCVVINILFAQAIGRWGNFVNGEVYGNVILDPALQWFPFGVEVNGQWRYALFFYESCINLIGFAILFLWAWFYTKKPNGVFTFCYFVWYGTVRALMEPLRSPDYILGSEQDVMWSQLTSVGMVIFGVIGLAVILIVNYRVEGWFWGSRKGDPCGITAYLTPYKDDIPYFSKINIMGKNYPPKPDKKKERDFMDEAPKEQEKDRKTPPQRGGKE